MLLTMVTNEEKKAFFIKHYGKRQAESLKHTLTGVKLIRSKLIKLYTSEMKAYRVISSNKLKQMLVITRVASSLKKDELET